MQDICHTDRQPLLAALEAGSGRMIETLRALCDINSGSRHLSGIRQVQAGLHQLFEPLSDTVEYRELAPPPPDADNGSLLESPCAPMQIFRARPRCPPCRFCLPATAIPFFRPTARLTSAKSALTVCTVPAQPT
ncbi:MAG: hypothetical protein LRY66_05430 [Saccharospirillaceae bacterium]|nr:hypothetical protein [Saccharospirillaceae bacterium]